jgi:hypothetical protein
MNTGHMVFEMQGTLGEVRQAITAMDKSLERSVSNLKETFEKDLDRVNKAIDKHQRSLDNIHRLLWILSGIWIVVAFLATQYGFGNILSFLTKK